MAQVGDAFSLDKVTLSRLVHSANSIQVQFGVRMDPDAIDVNKPKVKVIEGYRSQHSTHILPSIGGITIGPDVSLDSAIALGAINTLKCALLDIPFGGSGGGIKVDFVHHTDMEQKRIVQAYTRAIAARGYCNPAFDIISSDSGSDQNTMSWIVDTYRVYTKDSEINHLACVTGKAKAAQGISNRMSTEPHGCCIQVENALKDPHVQNMTGLTAGIEGKRFVIAGFGQRGRQLATELCKRGGVCVGILEKKNSIYSKEGIEIEHASHFWKLRRTWVDFPDVELYENQSEMLSEESDLFFPTTHVGLVHEQLAESLNSKVLVEVSKAPCTFKALEILEKNNIFVVPDLLASGGDMILNYLEWIKNISHQSAGQLQSKYNVDSSNKFAKDVLETLDFKLPSDFSVQKATESSILIHVMDELLTTAWDRVAEFRDKNQTDIRTACYVIAIGEIKKAHDIYGLTM